MSLLREIEEKREELHQLEKQYLRETPACQNTKCGFYRAKQTGHCAWSVLLENCREYKPEAETDEETE